jgi:hypothetical protein
MASGTNRTPMFSEDNLKDTGKSWQETRKKERTPLDKGGDKWKKYECACFSKIGQGWEKK